MAQSSKQRGQPAAEMSATTIEPRLLRRDQAAHYLGVSVATLDLLRLRGEVPPPVPVPGRVGSPIRCPLYDKHDLDLAILRWKQQGGGK